ncbi:MAG: hypothetical protein C4521_12375 [Actinobacteria bacterium]|nr:MAG: hypothetical protein C4521_12375 [Actinomycetota bacterium]
MSEKIDGLHLALAQVLFQLRGAVLEDVKVSSVKDNRADVELGFRKNGRRSLLCTTVNGDKYWFVEE